MAALEFSIRKITAADWRETRALRLEMLADTPHAYTETRATAELLPEAEWVSRAARGADPHSPAFAAIGSDGRWLGTMRGLIPDAETGALLAGVYVTPNARGREAGVTDALLAAVEEWARTEGDSFTLQVHENNVRARKYYERHGFTPTGKTTPYNLEPSQHEIHMRKQL